MFTRCRPVRVARLDGVYSRSLWVKPPRPVLAKGDTLSANISIRAPSPFILPLQALVPQCIGQTARFSTHEPACNDPLKSSATVAHNTTNQHPAHELIGTPCPGCGTVFQTDRPLDAGYLVFNDSPAPKRHSKEKQSSLSQPSATQTLPEAEVRDESIRLPIPQLNLPAGTKELTHDMYLERLAAIQQLDPDLGRQLGLIQPPSVADANDAEAHTSHSEDTKSIGDPSKSKKSERVVCSRCHSLTYHGTPLPPTADNIPSTGFFPAPTAPEPLFLQKIHNTPTNNVAVVVVSLLDFPLSLPQPVVDLLLSPRNLKQTSKDDKKVHKQRTILKTPVVIVANKFDLLPEGSNKDRVIEYLWRWFEDRDLHRNIQRIHVVSAKHPSGGDIRVLLKSLGNLWHDSDKGHITMIGAENVGKSALLNAMVREGGLNSGRLAGAQIQLIKERMDGEALQKKHKAQLQHLMLTAGKILSPEEQEEKLELERAIQSWNERKRVIDESANLSANADDPFSTTSAKYTTTVSNIPGTTLSKIKIPLAILARHFKSDYTMFKKRYLIDTPGIRADDDFTTKLTLDELKVSLPKKVLSPMSFMIEEGKSFFMGGLIRIDCLPQDTSVPLDSTSESKAVRRPRALKLTFFTALPLHKTSMAQANQLVKQSSMGQLTTLQPPFGSPERLALFPPLTPIRQGLIRIDIPLKHEMEEDGLDNLDIIRRRERSVDKRGRRILPFDKFEGICDIVFAGGLGWIMVSALPTADVVSPIRLRVWTPEGKGLAIRPKPLLPNLADDHLDRTAGGIRQKRKVFQPLPKKDVDSSTFSETDEVHSSTTL